MGDVPWCTFVVVFPGDPDSYSHATVLHSPVAPLTAMTLSHCFHDEMYSEWSLDIP
jgi:hypothetical protein